MNKDQLLSLREQILKDIVPLVLDSADIGVDRFSLLMRIIEAGNASKEVYDRAYESAKHIEDVNDRLEALMSLVDEIDVDVNVDQDTQEGAVLDVPEQAVSGNNDYTDNRQPVESGQNTPNDQ